MPKFNCYGKVVASKYLGTFEADTAEQAIDLAWEQAGVNLCHFCSSEAENAEIDEIAAEPEE